MDRCRAAGASGSAQPARPRVGPHLRVSSPPNRSPPGMDESGPTGSTETAAPPLLPTCPDPPSPGLLQELRERAQKALGDQRDHAAALEGKVSDQLSQAAEQLMAACVQQAEASLAEDRQAFVSERTEWEQLRDEIEGNLEQLRVSLQQQAESQQTRQQEIADAEAGLAAKRQELASWASEVAAERERVESLRRETQQEAQQLAESRPADGGESAEETASLREEINQLHKQRQDAAEHYSRLESELQTVVAQRDEAVASAVEFDEKFRLALDDVSRQRDRLAEMEQELATRPEAGAGESLELSGLRAERDQLLQHVADLEARPPEVAESSDDVEDLRRRFELAVEDVRQLKAEKADLEQQLAAGPPVELADEADGEMDWESQKRRLLASLDGEARPTPARQEEVAKIQGTIRITDEVVAEKDQLIAELQAALEQAQDGESGNVANDERLGDERRRLAELEKEWEEKLRAAELELSVERAKMARERLELENALSDLEAGRRQLAGSNDGKNQRRWLNKLGLSGGDEGKS
ncbi:MAG: hypothetical protein AAGJ46_03990 [Planctomycetota bacterium]